MLFKRKNLSRLIILFTVAFIVSLVGCNQNKNAPNENPTVNPSASVSPSFSDKPYQSAPPQHSGESPIAPDPTRRVYIGLSNQDCDIYNDNYFGSLHFDIITLQEYSTAEIKVELPMQTTHSIRIDNVTDVYRNWSKDNFLQGLSYYDYMCMRDADWRTLYELQLEADAKLAEIEAENIADFLEKRSKREAARKPYKDAHDQYLGDYELLTENDLPEFYVYNVNINIDGYVEPRAELYEETVSSAKISIGGEEYEVNFGEWRIHKSLPKELKAKPYGIQQNMVAVMAILDSPYNGGYVRLADALFFTANKDLTINEVHIYGSDAELLGAHVTLDGLEGTAQDFYWDAKMPLDVSAGQTLKADVFLHSERFKEYELNATAFVVVDYEADGAECSIVVPCWLDRVNNCSETYLLAFEDTNLDEYKRCFFVPSFERHLAELPESWKR